MDLIHSLFFNIPRRLIDLILILIDLILILVVDCGGRGKVPAAGGASGGTL
jgi:hypothetical protein